MSRLMFGVATLAAKGGIVAFALVCNVAHADVSLVCKNIIATLKTCNISIFDEIKRTDVAEFASAVDQAAKQPFTYFFLNSRGGDVDAAMAIGRRLRSEEAYVVVPESAVCASACVFLLAGAASRDVFGPVIVHRPYSSYVGDKSLDVVRSERERLKTRIRQYLDDMDVSQQLLELMDGIPSDRGKKLSADELVTLRLSGLEPAAQERFDANEAARLGVTREELLRRKQECKILLSEVGTKETVDLYNEISDVYIPCMERKRQ